jgi:hypothetical protein
LAETLRDLKAVEALKASIVQTAAHSIALAGGADLLIQRRGVKTGAGFWAIRPMSEKLWEAMAKEHADGQKALQD